MFTFNSQRQKSLLYLKGIIAFSPTPPLFSLHFCTATSSSSSSAASSFLITTLGFSPQSASKASRSVCFNSPERAESVISFFRNWGFSDSQLRSIIPKVPWLLSCNPNKRVLPKFQFLLSKGASASDIVYIVSRMPRFLTPSLKNRIVPTYELIHRFLQSDEDSVACAIKTVSFYPNGNPNLKFLVDHGVSDSNITRLLRQWPSIVCSTSLPKLVEEAKEWGFDPSKSTFSLAMLAMHTISKSRWDGKVGVLKEWGWSHEAFLEAFRRSPRCMLVSCDKIKAVMGFWVNELGWDPLVLVKGPDIFGFHLGKKIIPRGFVLQYLLAKGLRSKNASLVSPFRLTEETFLRKYVTCFEEEETFQLLKLYKEKMNIHFTPDNGCIQQLSNG